MPANEWGLTSHSQYRSAPKFSFTAAPAAKDKSKGAPGPGAYTKTVVEVDKFSRSASYSMSAACREGGKEYSAMPGPGAYSINSCNQTDAPKYGFSSESRLKTRKNDKGPGPGTYETRGKLEGFANSFPSKPEGISRHKNPGPGNYNPDGSWAALSHMGSSPKVSFGASSRADMVQSKNPGPGTYQHLECLQGNCVHKSPARYSIKGKFPAPKCDITPGPQNMGSSI